MSFDPPPLPPTQPTWGQFQIWWQAMVGGLKNELGALQAAQDALAAAVAAQSTADDVKRDDAITVSWTVPENPITATDAGSDATITVASHARLYGDGTKLDPVSGHTFLNQAYSTTYGIYYDDPTRADTTPTYHITTTLAQAQNGFVEGRHRVGEVTTPASGGGATYGGTVPSGSGYSVGSSGRYPSY